MTIAQPNELKARKPLRLWPGVTAAVLLVLIRLVVPLVAPEAEFFGVDVQLVGLIGGLLCAFTVIVWWVFFSRAPWFERVGGIVLMIVAMAATRPFTHQSIQNGMMGMMFFIYAIPVVSVAFVVWAVAGRRLSDGPRRAAMVAAILLGCGALGFVRTDGIIGAGSEFAWRWTPTAEERLLKMSDEPAGSARGGPIAPPPLAAPAEIPKAPIAPEAVDGAAARPPARDAATIEPAAPAAADVRAEWPGFRGPKRDGVIPGVQIATDWATSPPVEMWRRPIGPGWSSFAVRGQLLYTQEQRGDDEIVACYNLTTGKPVWMHRDATRFWESNGGAGPRATPTIHRDRIYAFGATGILNALDAGTGAVVWSRNAASDTHVPLPDWGFSSSPVVVDDVVIVAVSGALAAYDVATGAPRWSRKSGGGSYSSPHLVTIGGIAQILLMGGGGATSVAPADGTALWQHALPGSPIVQPALTANGDVLISTNGGTGGMGTHRLAVAHGPGGWTVEERWASSGLKPYFNDFVVHKGHAFGFDGNILACIDLEDGARKWKGGRYGNGQLVLLSDQDVLLVLSEEGELALVAAASDKFTELARFQALDGKTWNHPVLVGDVLLVRNGQEMAAFRLSLAIR